MTRSPFLCIAHRGGEGPENSREAIEKSLALAVEAIEIDVWNLHDELWVTHDRRLGRQLPGIGMLQQQTLDQLQGLQLENGETIPRLREVLEQVGNKALLNIEIKSPDCAIRLSETLRAHSRDYGLDLEQYIVSSFDHWQVYQMLELLPEVRRGALLAGVPLDYGRCCDELKAYSLHSNIGFTPRELVVDAHTRGVQSWVYTANHPDEWLALLALGADGAFTDHPRALLDFLAQQTGEAGDL